jgi:ribokinase
VTSVPAIKLVIVGHIAFNEDRTPYGRRVSLGGSAYYCARGASILAGQGIGLVASIGREPLGNRLLELGVDLRGVMRRADQPTARFTVTQSAHNTREFEAHPGGAMQTRPQLLPSAYEEAEHFHLATMPPSEQMTWLRRLRRVNPAAAISIDTFEAYVEQAPAETRAVVEAADMIFANEQEAHRLALRGWLDRQLVLKLGARGAVLIAGSHQIHAAAPRIRAVDTTGAGELLAGVLLAERTAGLDQEVALQHAVSVASASVSDFGVDHWAVHAALFRAREAMRPRSLV